MLNVGHLTDVSNSAWVDETFRSCNEYFGGQNKKMEGVKDF